MESETDCRLVFPENFQSVESEGSESETSRREAGAFPPYFKVPNAVYDIGLPPYEALVLVYLMRRANKKGECFPSLPRICRDTGIKSLTTVRKALRSLRERGLISLVSQLPGKKHLYQVHPFACEAAAKVSPAGKSKNETTPTSGEGVPLHAVYPKEYPVKEDSVLRKTQFKDRLQRELGASQDATGLLSLSSKGTPSSGEGVPLHKEKQPGSLSPPLVSLRGKALEGEAKPKVIRQRRGSPLVEANEYYHILTPAERETLDREARRLHHSDTEPTIGEVRELRVQYFQLQLFAKQTYRWKPGLKRVATTLDAARL